MKKRIEYTDILTKLKTILQPEVSFFITAIIYGIGVSLLMLALPISVQALINTVTFGVVLQPLIILSIVLLGLLLFSSCLSALRTYTIESFQHHFFARMSSDIVTKVLNSSTKSLKEKEGLSLVNRYFDIMTIQKSMTSLLTGGVSIVMQTFVGLILLAFYHPYFLVFDILLILSVYLIWNFYARSGFETAIAESKAKYDMGYSLDELVKLESFGKSLIRREKIIERADEKIKSYILKRRKHFKNIFQQHILLLLLYSLMSALILGLGGYLVITQQLSLGQLVAAELVVTVILASFTKAHKYIEALYDLYAAVDKLSIFYELDKEDNLYTSVEDIAPGDLTFKNTTVNLGGTKYQFNKTFEESKKYHIRSSHYTYHAIFMELLQGSTVPNQGSLFYGKNHFGELPLPALRDHIYVVNKPYLIEGTVQENLSFGNPEFTRSGAREALKTCSLEVVEDYFKKGLNTEIHSTGYPLWSNQIYRLELARILLSPAKVVVISRFFDQIGPERRNAFLEKFFETDKTLILISNHDYPQFKFDECLHFIDGNIVPLSKANS